MTTLRDLTAMFDPPRVKVLRAEYLEMIRAARSESRRGLLRRQLARSAEVEANRLLADGKIGAAQEMYARARAMDGKADARWQVAWKHIDWARRRQAEIQQALLEANHAH